mmetsp:Transcript_61288/g.144648  ORF Transcript_61288/g.144648 Transcript_61288/m.144648 type:complete len:81 (+) Transcript_61288:59-301(+)
MDRDRCRASNRPQRTELRLAFTASNLHFFFIILILIIIIIIIRHLSIQNRCHAADFDSLLFSHSRALPHQPVMAVETAQR